MALQEHIPLGCRLRPWDFPPGHEPQSVRVVQADAVSGDPGREQTQGGGGEFEVMLTDPPNQGDPDGDHAQTQESVHMVPRHRQRVDRPPSLKKGERIEGVRRDPEALRQDFENRLAFLILERSWPGRIPRC